MVRKGHMKGIPKNIPDLEDNLPIFFIEKGK